MPPLLIAVMGQTASGKTELAEGLADRLGAQLVNADTFQAYRGMDVGTAKSARKAEYALIDVKNPDEPFGVGEWVHAAASVAAHCFERQRNVVFVGGSGLNIRALLEGYADMSPMPTQKLRVELNGVLESQGLGALIERLRQVDPDALVRVDFKNPVRVIRAIERASSTEKVPAPSLPPFEVHKLTIKVPMEALNARIAARAKEMVAGGWIEEVEMLRKAGYRPTAPAFRAHGYREIWRVLDGEIGLAEALDSITAQVRRYAKRQRTWLRKEPRLKVLEASPSGDALSLALADLFASGESVARNGEDH